MALTMTKLDTLYPIQVEVHAIHQVRMKPCNFCLLNMNVNARNLENEQHREMETRLI
jgi:sulfur transfer complex TusBCD TusB component (DsrH family)